MENGDKTNIYNQLIDISKRIGNIETGIKDLNDKFDCLPCTQQESRIDALEKQNNFEKGIIVTVGVIAGAVIDFVSQFIIKKLL
jgi:hypothetical protein